MRKIWMTAALGLVAVGMPAAARAQVVVVSNSVQEREAQPGERYSGEIRVRNQSGEARAVRVYQTDYLFQADGSNAYPAPGSHVRSNGSWTTVSPTDLVVPGGEEAVILYEVAVPSDPAEAGTYWSMIMVEPTTSAGEVSADPSRPSVGLRTTVRFGVQIATHVAGEVQHRLRLGNPRVVLDEDGARHLQFELVNEGDIGYRPKVSLEVFDRSGGRSAAMEAQRGLIYPGTSALQRFDLAELPAGEYQAVIVVDTGSLEVFGAQFDLTVGATD
jgi:hypothetical protein